LWNVDDTIQASKTRQLTAGCGQAKKFLHDTDKLLIRTASGLKRQWQANL